MKISNEPTPYLLLKAGTDSAWDCCDFAIVYLSKEWRQTQSGRLEAVKPFKDDISFQSLNFYDMVFTSRTRTGYWAARTCRKTITGASWN